MNCDYHLPFTTLPTAVTMELFFQLVGVSFTYLLLLFITKPVLNLIYIIFPLGYSWEKIPLMEKHFCKISSSSNNFPEKFTLIFFSKYSLMFSWRFSSDLNFRIRFHQDSNQDLLSQVLTTKTKKISRFMNHLINSEACKVEAVALIRLVG